MSFEIGQKVVFNLSEHGSPDRKYKKLSGEVVKIVNIFEWKSGFKYEIEFKEFKVELKNYESSRSGYRFHVQERELQELDLKYYIRKELNENPKI